MLTQKRLYVVGFVLLTTRKKIEIIDAVIQKFQTKDGDVLRISVNRAPKDKRVP